MWLCVVVCGTQYANCTGNTTAVASCLTKLSTDAVLTAQAAAAKNITATGVDSLMVRCVLTQLWNQPWALPAAEH